MALKIHAFPPSPRAFKVLAVAEYLGLPYEFILCDLTKGMQKADAYAVINPNQKMPALEDGDFRLWESNAIIQYLASKKPDTLLPLDEQARADVARWMFWESTTWDSAAATLAFENFVKGFFGLGAPDPARVAEGEQKFNFAARILDAHLKGRDYVVGGALTLADFSLAAALTLAEPARLPLAPYAEIQRWGARMATLPAWSRVRAMQQQPAPA
ncbi:MAG: glutathione S-transferase family protein [Hyphomonadaceae bacterium]|nr:glutathione S-transferase family protein [Hyphomonadaceae bacterium]MCA8885116.1 glutathione S-transferase family protein [Hyphomonadaceae bacterium]